jgi:prepilin-type N-terminal cleavage/methylation domain-containing protein
MFTFQSLPSPRKARSASRRAFTLVEIMVVVAIIVILVGILVAVGTRVKQNAQINATKGTLETLRGCMSDYLKNNPEPPGIVVFPSTVAVAQPAVFLPALNSDPATASMLKNMKEVTLTNVVDGFGQTIVYVHSVTSNGVVTSPGYFVSGGPDEKMGHLSQKPTPDPDTADNIMSATVAP